MHGDLHSAVAADMPRLQAILEDLVRIPSVSVSGYDPANLERSAVTVAGLFADVGIDSRVLRVEGAPPAVFGELAGPAGAPTVLLYAHHDVQPPGPMEAWNSEPFAPEVRDGRLYGRGSSDDKAGIVIHLGALAALGVPPVGVKLFIEGEEEVGSHHLTSMRTQMNSPPTSS